MQKNNIFFLLIAWFFFISSCKVFDFEKKIIQQSKEILTKKRDIRLEFRGRIYNIPEGINPPFTIRARVYLCPELRNLHYSNSDQEIFPPCMDTFIEKIQKFETSQFSIDLDVPDDWTHSYIELLGLDAIKGKFSPGHNPNWFDYSTGEIVTLRHDFVFRSQENPIPNKKQEEFATRFAPILVLQEGKKEIPSNLEKYHNNYKIEKVNNPKFKKNKFNPRYVEEDLMYMVLPDPEELPGYNKETDPIHIYYHVRYADTQVSGTQPEALPGFRDNYNYWYQKGDGKIVISYWIWMDRNYGPSKFGNYHQGDLESYSVLVDSKGNPLRILITGHNHILLDTEWNNINSWNHHPILYIASGNQSDGGNPLSAYGGYEVFLDAGNALLNFISDPRDIFPDIEKNSFLILPRDVNIQDLHSVLIGPSIELGKLVDLTNKKYRQIDKLVQWEEPGWIQESSFQDPDGNHIVPFEIADFLKFPGRIGKHPITKFQFFRLRRVGNSPENAPFKTNIEQHYTYEKPNYDRSHSGRLGDYGPKFYGNSLTPQFSPNTKQPQQKTPIKLKQP